MLPRTPPQLPPMLCPRAQCSLGTPGVRHVWASCSPVPCTPAAPSPQHRVCRHPAPQAPCSPGTPLPAAASCRHPVLAALHSSGSPLSTPYPWHLAFGVPGASQTLFSLMAWLCGCCISQALTEHPGCWVLSSLGMPLHGRPIPWAPCSSHCMDTPFLEHPVPCSPHCMGTPFPGNPLPGHRAPRAPCSPPAVAEPPRRCRQQHRPVLPQRHTEHRGLRPPALQHQAEGHGQGGLYQDPPRRERGAGPHEHHLGARRGTRPCSPCARHPGWAGLGWGCDGAVVELPPGSQGLSSGSGGG